MHVVVGLLLWLNLRVSRELGEAMVGSILLVLLINKCMPPYVIELRFVEVGL